MTFGNVAVKNASHPLQRVQDASVFHYDIAMVVPPSEVIGAVVQCSVAQLPDVKEVELRYRQIRGFSAFGLRQAVEKALAGQLFKA